MPAEERAQAASPAAPAAPSSFDEASVRRGRALYHDGVGASGEPVMAVLRGGTTIAASALPCVGCHGRDGQGVREGGVSPSAITWEALTKPYGDTAASGRVRPPYTEALFRRAVTMGVDAGGSPLDPIMPRYQLTLEGAKDLTAYMSRLGDEAGAGVSPDALALATVVFEDGPSAAASAAVYQALVTYLDLINARGGVFGRTLVVSGVRTPSDPERMVEALERAISERPPLALVGVLAAGVEAPLAALAARLEVPIVGALTPSPLGERPLNPYVFYLHGGVDAEIEALSRYADGHLRAPLIVADAAGAGRAALIAAERRGAGLAAEVMTASMVDGDVIARRRQRRADAVLFLGPRDGLREALEVAADRSAPWLVPRSLIEGDVAALPAAWRGRLLIGAAVLPTDFTRGAMQLAALAERREVSRGYEAAQIMALAMTAALAEAIVRCGRRIDRQALVEALEGLYRFDSGFSPPLTFDANRRVGMDSGRVVTPADGGASGAGFRVVVE